MDGWMGGWMGGWVDGWVGSWICWKGWILENRWMNL